MKLKLLIFGLLLGGTTSAFASGGTCPSGAVYVNPADATGAKVTLSSLGITSCYYISAAGNDSNDGLSEASGHPWLHAPGMPNCSGTCATVQSTCSFGTGCAGLGFIFRGGDTYNAGSSTSPAIGGTWDATSTGTGGTLTHPIYLGNDPGWYSGASWSRVVVTGDNPLCGPNNVGGACSQGNYDSYNLKQYYLSSCSYQIGSGNNLLNFTGASNYIVDGFELTGLCQNDAGTPNGTDQYISYGFSQNMDFVNLYIHGWSHTQFEGPISDPSCSTSAVCANMRAYSGGSTGATPDDTFRFDVTDGSDSDPIALVNCYCDFWDVAYSYIGYQSGVIVRNGHLFDNNLYEYWYENGHGNVLEEVAGASGTNANYDNVYRHINPTNDPGDPMFWPFPPPGTTDYFFNNLMYDVTNMEYFNIGQNPPQTAGQGPIVAFNNTFQYNTNAFIFGCSSPYPYTWTAKNNHYVTDDSSIYSTSACTTGANSDVGSLTMTNAAATAAGYTGSQTYGYSPTSGSSPTVNVAGTTTTSAYCSALTSAGLTDAAAKCLNDTTYGANYNSTTHIVSATAPRSSNIRPTSGVQNDGTYQYSSSGGTPTASLTPSPLAFGYQTNGTTSGVMYATLSNTGSASLTITNYVLTTGTQFAIVSNTCSLTYANSLPFGQSCLIGITFTPTSSGAKSDILTVTDNSGGIPGSQQSISLTGTGIAGPTWTLNQHVSNYTCTGTTVSTTQSCTVISSVAAGHTLILASAIWSNSDTPTFNAATGDSFTHCSGCYADGTNSPKAFASDAVYILKATASSSQAYTFTWNTVASSWSIDVDLIDVTVTSGTVALDGANALGYTYPACSTPCTSPSLSLSGTSDFVLQWGGLGYGPATAPGAPYTSPSDIDPDNVWGAFFGAVDQASVPTITWSSTPNNYPATSVIAFKSVSSTGLAAPAIILSNSN